MYKVAVLVPGCLTLTESNTPKGICGAHFNLNWQQKPVKDAYSVSLVPSSVECSCLMFLGNSNELSFSNCLENAIYASTSGN